MTDTSKERIEQLESQMVAKTDAPPEPVAEVPDSVPDPAIALPAATPDGEEDPEASANSDGDDPAAKPRQNKGVGKRINELTRERYEERRAREAAEQRIAQLEQALQQRNPQQSQPEPTQGNGRPTLEQFGYDQDVYEAARDTWLIEQTTRKWSESQQAQEAQKQAQVRADAFKGRVAEFEKEQPGGWEEAITAPFDPTPAMLEAIKDSEIGPRIGYYLMVQHLDEAEAISRLPAHRQLIAMGQIEARLQAAVSAPASNRPPATVTNAPAVPATVSAISPGRKAEADKSVSEMIDDMRAKRTR